MVQISVCHAYVRIILKVNRQQDRNEELTEERTVEDAIVARVRGRRTEARRQTGERAPSTEKSSKSGSVHKIDLVSEGGALVGAGRWNKAASLLLSRC